MEKEIFDEEISVLSSKIKDLEKELKILKDERSRKEKAKQLYFGDKIKKPKKDKSENKLLFKDTLTE